MEPQVDKMQAESNCDVMQGRGVRGDVDALGCQAMAGLQAIAMLPCSLHVEASSSISRPPGCTPPAWSSMNYTGVTHADQSHRLLYRGLFHRRNTDTGPTSLSPVKKAPCMVAGYLRVVCSPAKKSLSPTLSAMMS